MNDTQPRPINITLLIATLVIGGSIAVVLIAAIAGEQLGDVVSAIAVTGAIFVAALGVVALIVRLAADPIVKINSTQLDRQIEANRHEEKMVSFGLWIPDRGYAQLPPPPEQEYDVPLTSSGVVASDVDKFFDDACNLVALSAQWHRENHIAKPTQLAPQRIAAKMHDYFRGSEGFTRWHNAMLYFTIKQMAVEDKQGGRSKGTYLKGATPEEIYKRMKALPHPGAA